MCIEQLKTDRDVEGLIRLLDDEAHSVRKQAIMALVELGDVSCASPIAQKLRDPYMDIRIEAIKAFVKMGNQAVDPLIEALKDPNVNVREGAVIALEKIGDARAISPLIEALKDTNRKKISDALRSIGQAAFQPLIEALKNDDSRIRIGAAIVLGEMNNPDAVNALVKAKKDSDPLVRQYAASAIHNIKQEVRKKKNKTSKKPRFS